MCKRPTQERKAVEEKRRASFFFIPTYAECRSAALLAGTPGGPASWCVLHQRPAIHFPRLWFMDCCVGVGARVYVCVWRHRALLPLELVHCPASSCFATQWAGAANLHRQTVTYFSLSPAGWRWVAFMRDCVYELIFTGAFSPGLRRILSFFLFFP